jgi:cytochrome c553
MIKTALSYLAALAALAPAAASAGMLGKSIAEQGNGQGAPPCSSCHGATYEGDPAIKAPALAGLPADYIVARLTHYASPEGHNPSMKLVATALSPSERVAVATYLASLKSGPKPAAGSGSPGR